MTPFAQTAARWIALAGLCASCILLIPLEQWLAGGVVWLAASIATWASGDRTFRLRMGILLGCIAILAVAPIHTERSTMHFITLGIPFAVVVIAPTLILRRWDRADIIDWTLLPRSFSRMETFYTLISIPLAWGIIRLYFGLLNPELPTHWPMPEVATTDALNRLFFGINAVGVWDELFFISTSYAILRSLFPSPWCNLAQAVIYTSVLYHMAFTGAGPLIIYAFALTQGIMFERSRCLLYVLIVHLIVDWFLVMAILQHYYPGQSFGIHWTL